jgi:chemotaxis protein MotB
VQRNNPGTQAVIIIKRRKAHGHGHHGGSWKVALADFMTAMMAFFLLLWLLEAATPKELSAIAGYFQDPLTNQFTIGPGGSDSAIIEMNSPEGAELKQDDDQRRPDTDPGVLDSSTAENAEERETARIEMQELAQLKAELESEINNTESALHQLKDQIHMELTEQGLSIQIVDKERRPMFDGGSAYLHDYAVNALAALAGMIRDVRNRISIVGHTDATPYSVDTGYSNWELSTDRANSARRQMVESSYPEHNIIAVQGMAAVAPFLPDNPYDPSNRRIAIVVLKEKVAQSMLEADRAPTAISPAMIDF